MEDVNGFGLRLLVETLHLLLPQTKIQQKMTGPGGLRKGNKHRIDFLGIAEAVQPHVHSCAPKGVMMFGSGHFQDHRAVVLDFSTVEMTGPQVARQYRTAICGLSACAAGVSPLLMAIGVDSIPPEACRVAGRAYWCQLAEIVKEVIKCNRFPDVWKGGIMCGIPRKPRAPSTPEHSRGILISTAPCTLVGKAVNKRVTQVVEATSKS